MSKYIFELIRLEPHPRGDPMEIPIWCERFEVDSDEDAKKYIKGDKKDA